MLFAPYHKSAGHPSIPFKETGSGHTAHLVRGGGNPPLPLCPQDFTNARPQTIHAFRNRGTAEIEGGPAPARRAHGCRETIGVYPGIPPHSDRITQTPHEGV